MTADGNGAGVTKIRRRGRPRTASRCRLSSACARFGPGRRSQGQAAQGQARRSAARCRSPQSATASPGQVTVARPLASIGRYGSDPGDAALAAALTGCSSRYGCEIQPAAADSVLALWATAPMLADALRVMAGWDFHYRSCACWSTDLSGGAPLRNNGTGLFADGHRICCFSARAARRSCRRWARHPRCSSGGVHEPGGKPDAAYARCRPDVPGGEEDRTVCRGSGGPVGRSSTPGADDGAGMARSAVEEAEEARRLRRLRPWMRLPPPSVCRPRARRCSRPGCCREAAGDGRHPTAPQRPAPTAR